MSDGVHLLVPFAASDGDAFRAALPTLALPHLEKLLARLVPLADDAGEPTTLSMPHDRVLARECGLAAPDGCVPWAAWQVAQAGRDPGGEAWAWITPCHWKVGTYDVVMTHPAQLQLDTREALALLQAMAPYFEQDGLRLEYEAPTLWLARGEVFRGLPTAALDRVVGQLVDPWLPRSDAARPLRRLQQEMQMLLYTHPVNDARTRGGLPPVNSFWISGTGALPPGPPPAPPLGLQVTHALRDAVMQGDLAAWKAAWHQLDAHDCPRLLHALDEGSDVRLTLCGARHARTWGRGAGGLWRRMAAALSRPRAADVLETL